MTLSMHEICVNACVLLVKELARAFVCLWPPARLTRKEVVDAEKYVVLLAFSVCVYSCLLFGGWLAVCIVKRVSSCTYGNIMLLTCLCSVHFRLCCSGTSFMDYCLSNRMRSDSLRIYQRRRLNNAATKSLSASHITQPHTRRATERFRTFFVHFNGVPFPLELVKHPYSGIPSHKFR